MAVDCQHSLHLCGDKMKMSVPNIFFFFFFFFFRETPTSPWDPFRAVLPTCISLVAPWLFSVCLQVHRELGLTNALTQSATALQKRAKNETSNLPTECRSLSGFKQF